MSDDDVDLETKVSAGEKCANLLASLGRQEERSTLLDILRALKDDFFAQK